MLVLVFLAKGISPKLDLDKKESAEADMAQQEK